MKAGDTGPIELYLYLDETEPLDFSVSAQDLTAVNVTNDISLNFATGTEVGKQFKFSWRKGGTTTVYLHVEGKHSINIST